jgi:hypothetical protein
MFYAIEAIRLYIADKLQLFDRRIQRIEEQNRIGDIS